MVRPGSGEPMRNADGFGTGRFGTSWLIGTVATVKTIADAMTAMIAIVTCRRLNGPTTLRRARGRAGGTGLVAVGSTGSSAAAWRARSSASSTVTSSAGGCTGAGSSVIRTSDLGVERDELGQQREPVEEHRDADRDDQQRRRSATRAGLGG